MATATHHRGGQAGGARLGAASLAAELRVSVLRTARRLRAEKSDAELSDTAYSVLARLDHLGPLTPSELADHERVQPPSMTKVIAGLVARGLVTRSEHPHDRRQAVVSLTAVGRSEVKETRRRRDAWLARRLAELEPEQRRVLAEASGILRRIADS
jgi:DNA-binding MarR family transcriptional regulator